METTINPNKPEHSVVIKTSITKEDGNITPSISENPHTLAKTQASGTEVDKLRSSGNKAPKKMDRRKGTLKRIPPLSQEIGQQTNSQKSTEPTELPPKKVKRPPRNIPHIPVKSPKLQFRATRMQATNP